MPERYSQEDVQGILQQAIARQVDDVAFSAAQLQSMADELGIQPQVLAQAVAEWRQSQQRGQEIQQFLAYRRGQLKSHGMKYFLVTSGILLVDGLAHGHLQMWGPAGLAWPYWLPLVWGLALVWDVWTLVDRDSAAYQKKLNQWRRRQQLHRWGQEVGQTLEALWQRWAGRLR